MERLRLSFAPDAASLGIGSTRWASSTIVRPSTPIRSSPSRTAWERSFPFWVPGPNGDGYVELPYTLSARSRSLFIVLDQQDIEIWKKKIDWIAERGGMVLLNTHPDYMCFDQDKPAQEEFPVSRYEELLSYVREKYEGRYWAALPRDVASYYCAKLAPELRNSRKKICMLAYTGYETDNRVRRYAETLVKRGDQVDVISLKQSEFPAAPRGAERRHHISGSEPQLRRARQVALRLASGAFPFRFILFSGPPSSGSPLRSDSRSQYSGFSGVRRVGSQAEWRKTDSGHSRHRARIVRE